MTSLLDQTSLGEEVFLILGDIVERRFCILLARDRKIELILLLRQEVEERSNVPHVLLPVELGGPGAVPWAIAHIFWIFIEIGRAHV